MKYPNDFKGWLPLGILGDKYFVLEKPDHKYQALIHVEGERVVEVIEMKSGESVYSTPRDLKRARALLTLLKMDHWMYQAYQKF